MTELTVRALTEMVGGRCVGDGDLVIRGLGDLRNAGPELVGFVRDPRDPDYAAAARDTAIGALLTTCELETPAQQVIVADVDHAFVVVARHFHPMPKAVEHELHPTAVVHDEAVLEAPVVVGPHAVIGRSRIGAGSVIRANVTIGDGVTLGRDCVLYPGVTIYDRVTFGDRVFVHSGAVIGSDGFGYKSEGGTWHKVPQLGGVRVGNDVEFGSNTIVDRGAINDTVIEDGCKFDNHCHIAHNVRIGSNTLMAAGAMVAGSTTVGKNNLWGGRAACGDHLKIADNVMLGGGTSALSSIRRAGEYIGYPPVEKKLFLRVHRALADLPEMRADWAAQKKGS